MVHGDIFEIVTGKGCSCKLWVILKIIIGCMVCLVQSLRSVKHIP